MNELDVFDFDTSSFDMDTDFDYDEFNSQIVDTYKTINKSVRNKEISKIFNT